VAVPAPAQAGGGGTAFLDAARAQALTGASAPAETAEAQFARALSIHNRMDKLPTISTVYFERSDTPGFSRTVVPNCGVVDGTNYCQISFPDSTNDRFISYAVSYEEYDSDEEAEALAALEDGAISDLARTILTRNGITLLENIDGNFGPNYREYGAWMDHSAFAVETGHGLQESGVTVTSRSAQARGDLTGSRPAANATWRGLMVGTPARGARRDNLLQGDATLTFTADDNQIDATFSDIVDLDRNAPHSVEEVRFRNVPVAADGTYAQGSGSNRIEGGFYGTNHAETAGIFEQRNIVGAYGAKRE